MMAFVEVAQADTVAKFGPLKPYFIDIIPAAISVINFGMKNGLNRGIAGFFMKESISS